MSTNIETGTEIELSAKGKLDELHRDVERTTRNPEITKREGRLAYCKVHPGDSIPKIRDRLSKYPEFSYLKEKVYDGNGRNEIGFNINPKHLKPGMDLMVPLKLESRQVEDSAFLEGCRRAINNIKSNSTYGKKVGELINKIGEKNLARVMSAFAKVETAGGKSGVKIGTGGLYRYESTSTYSISYYHVLTKSEYAGDKARKNLGMSVGDTCDPVKAGMFFLGYRCECESYAKSKFGYKLEDCLNPTKPGWYNKAAKIYNSGSSTYPSLLKNSYEIFKKIG